MRAEMGGRADTRLFLQLILAGSSQASTALAQRHALTSHSLPSKTDVKSLFLVMNETADFFAIC